MAPCLGTGESTLLEQKRHRSLAYAWVAIVMRGRQRSLKNENEMKWLSSTVPMAAAVGNMASIISAEHYINPAARGRRAGAAAARHGLSELRKRLNRPKTRSGWNSGAMCPAPRTFAAQARSVSSREPGGPRADGRVTVAHVKLCGVS